MALAALLLTITGCERAEKTPTQPPRAAAEPPTGALVPDAANWSREEALARLGDKTLALSAAVRLVQLADVQPLCVPQPLSQAMAARLRLVPLAEGTWALGLADRGRHAVLRAPVLIGSDGGVTAVAAGIEEEALELHVSRDADVFPHLLISPPRVWIAAIPPHLALTRDVPATVGFQARVRDGYGYIGLMLRGEAGWIEVAAYRWEPYEMGFAGPAADQLPEPPGGKFALDMSASPLLIPQGGEIPPPKPRPMERPSEDRSPGGDA